MYFHHVHAQSFTIWLIMWCNWEQHKITQFTVFTPNVGPTVLMNQNIITAIHTVNIITWKISPNHKCFFCVQGVMKRAEHFTARQHVWDRFPDRVQKRTCSLAGTQQDMSGTVQQSYFQMPTLSACHSLWHRTRMSPEKLSFVPTGDRDLESTGSPSWPHMRQRQTGSSVERRRPSARHKRRWRSTITSLRRCELPGRRR